MIEKTLSSTVAPAAFGVALLCAGQLSTFTSTVAGQVVLRGFLNVRLSTPARRLVTRVAAIAPAAALQAVYGDSGAYHLLLVLQVVLALQLPFALIPLIKATSSRRLMGAHRNGAVGAAAAWASGAAVFAANVAMLAAQLAPGAAFLPAAKAAEGGGGGGGGSAAVQYIEAVAALAWESPVRCCVVFFDRFFDRVHPSCALKNTTAVTRPRYQSARSHPNPHNKTPTLNTPTHPHIKHSTRRAASS